MVFEADCLAHYRNLRVCTFLLGLKQSDLRPPLSRFTHTEFTKDDVYRLVLTISSRLALQPANKPLHPATLGIIFNHYWPGFEHRIREIAKPAVQNSREIHADLDKRLEEMLETLRGGPRNGARIPEIHEPVPPNIMALTERRYFTLVNETGVSPKEAIKRIMKELDRKYLLQAESRNMIFGHLMDFIRVKSQY